MYATEKYVKMEVKELRETINDAANDLGGDIKYLHSMLVDMQETISLLQQAVQEIREQQDV